MSFNDFMNKVRHWDNLIAKWLMRHFYFMFFQLVLVVIFVFWMTNTINIIDLSFQTSREAPVIEKLAVSQSVNMTIIVLLLLLNSFWLLYIFNSIQRIRNVLKDVNFNITKLRFRDRSA